MKEKKTPKKVERRKFLLQAGGGTLAVGFGAGLTSCASGGGPGGGGGWSGPYVPRLKKGTVTGTLKPTGPELSGGLEFEFGNDNNNSGEVTFTYDSITDSTLAENLTQEDIVCATYGLDEYDGVPVDLDDLEVILAPGQSFSYTEPSEESLIITNTSSTDIDLGGGVVLEPNETLDLFNDV